MNVTRLNDRDPGDVPQPPNDQQAEQAVLGSILKSPRSISTVTSLRPECFYDARNRYIWTAALSLFDRAKPIDYQTLSAELERLGVYDASGGLLYLAELDIKTPSASHIEHYAKAIRDCFIRRQLISAAQEVSEIAWRGARDVEEIARTSISKVMMATEEAPTVELLSPQGENSWPSTYMNSLQSIEEGGSLGVSTGMRDVDRITLGFTKGSFCTVIARSGAGKSDFSLQMASSVALGFAPSDTRCKAGTGNVLMISIEMGLDQLAERGVSQESGIDKKKLLYGQLAGQDAQRVTETLQVFEKSKLWFAIVSKITTRDIRSLALQLESRAGPIDLIVVDYLQLLSDDDAGGSRAYSLDKAVQNLKALAGEMQCAVLSPCQVKRELDARAIFVPRQKAGAAIDPSDHEMEQMRTMVLPGAAEVRDTGGIEFAADWMLSLARPHMYFPDYFASEEVQVQNVKHRRYGTLYGMTASLWYNGRYQTSDVSVKYRKG